MGVGRGWKITLCVRNRAIFWIFVGILLVQGTLAESTNATSEETTESPESDEVEVVSLVKKDKRQAQRGYTDVPLDRGPFDELTASSPAPIAFENDLPTFVDSLSDIADSTPADYNSNKFSGFRPTGSKTGAPKYVEVERSQTTSPLTSHSPSPATQNAFIVTTNNNLGSLTNISRPLSFFNQGQIPLALNNGVPFGPVSSGSGFSGPGITPTGRLSDSLALPDNTAAAALNIERRQVDLPDGPVVNEPPPFNGKAIPGDAGIDYPIFGEVPRTAFSCKDHKWPGYYADTQARCQVFWICQKHRMDGFLCPNGTLFNQQVFVCDWWFNVDCSAAPEYYSRNQFIYAGPGIGIDGQPVRGLSLPIASSNRVANVLPPLPPPVRNNALLAPPVQGSQVQSSNQVARVSSVTARPPDFQSRADSLNNYLKSVQGGGSGPSYQSQLASRMQNNPNRLHDVKPTTPSPPAFNENDKRVPAASSQISQAQITSGTSRPIALSNYQPQHVETVSIVTTPYPTTRVTTPRPPPPPIPKLHISPTAKPIKGPSPTPFANVIKLGTTVTITSTPKPDYSTKQSLFKGIISSTVKPSKASGFKLSSSNLVASSQQHEKTVSLNHPTHAPNYYSRPGTTEDPTNTVRPADYSPSRAPDPTPPSAFSSPGYLPTNRPQNYVESASFGRGHQFTTSSLKTLVSHGMRSNQFSNSNVNGQRENIYASTSRKDTFVEFPYSPSQQKYKQKLAEQALNKDISSSKTIVTAVPHFFGQRSNVFGGTDSFSFISNNNKQILIDHTNYSQRQGPFTKPRTSINHNHPQQVHHDNHKQYLHQQQNNNLQHAQHTGPPRQQQIIQHTTTRAPQPPPTQYLDSTGPSPSRPTPTLIPPPQHIPQQHIPVTSTIKPEQRFIVTYTPSPPPQHIPSSTAQYHQQVPPQHLQSTFPPPPIQHHHPPPLTRNDAVTQRDGFAHLNAGSFVSIQTTAPPFSQQILKHNSLQPYHDSKNSGGIVTYTSTGPPPTPQQVIFSNPPTAHSNFAPFAPSTAAPRTFSHGPPQQNLVLSSTPQPHHNHNLQSTPSPYFEQVSLAPSVAPSPTPYSTPNNYIAAPTQSPFHSTSPGHRQNPYLPHNHGKQKSKQQHRPPPVNAGGNGNGGVSFPQGGITTTIKYPEGTGKLRLDFSGGNSNRKNIVDFTYSASPTPTAPSNYIHHSSTTPYPSNTDRFNHAVSSTTGRPQSSARAPASGRSSGRLAGAVTNKSNLSSSAIYVDTAATAESVSTPVTVPSPSATTPSSVSPLPPVSTSSYGLRLSATAKKRMTGAWQSYFSSKSES